MSDEATVYLTRRNLLTLLSKLDRNVVDPGASQCTLIKNDTSHPSFPSTHVVTVIAVEDHAYYDRTAGVVHPSDDPTRRSSLDQLP
jgi:hypothetical protein